jgi:hypothetical protein
MSEITDYEEIIINDTLGAKYKIIYKYPWNTAFNNYRVYSETYDVIIATKSTILAGIIITVSVCHKSKEKFVISNFVSQKPTIKWLRSYANALVPYICGLLNDPISLLIAEVSKQSSSLDTVIKSAL